MRMYVRERADEILKMLVLLQKELLRQAEKYVDGIMPAYSHLQQAQPVRIAHWFLAYREMFARDAKRFHEARKSANVMPLGSGALAGTNFDIDRNYLARLLGFDSVTQNSMDGVADRDFAVDFCYAVSMLFSHLSRLSEDVIIFSSGEFGAVTLPDELCTGSSIMPQKKNPDLPELLRAKSGRTAGNLFNLLMIVKGLPLAYNKDLQEDKPPVFDSAEQAVTALPLAARLVKKMKFNTKLLKERVSKGQMTAVDIADYLVLKGMPFRDAHHVVGSVVRFCEESGISFTGIALKELKKQSKLFEKDVFDYLDPAKSPDRKKGIGSTSRDQIMKQIKRLKRELK
jgi:argininosuccinate lyase